MWRNITPLEERAMSEFEQKFRFRIDPALRQFIIDHNGGIPSPGTFLTTARERRFEQLLDFSDTLTGRGAWAINERLRYKIGEKRIIIGTDANSNFICLERDYKTQYIVVWNHFSNSFERCIADIPVLLQSLC